MQLFLARSEGSLEAVTDPDPDPICIDCEYPVLTCTCHPAKTIVEDERGRLRVEVDGEDS